MSTTIKHIRSSVAGRTPTTAQLPLGVLAINTADGKVFIKKDVSGTETIVEIGGTTAAEILASLLTVDGTGSGLDADKLDGQEGSYYLDYNNFTNTPSNSAAGPIALTKYTISTNVTLASGYNGLSVGPVEVSNGITVEVPQNSCWRILD